MFNLEVQITFIGGGGEVLIQPIHFTMWVWPRGHTHILNRAWYEFYVDVFTAPSDAYLRNTFDAFGDMALTKWPGCPSRFV